MLRILLIALICGWMSVLAVQAAEDDALPDTFDPALAAELGADQYGMRRYVIAFLHAGPDQSHSAEQAQAIMRGHMQAMRDMADAGKLVMAGPFLDGGDLRGLFVFNVESLEEAKALTASDPAVASGRLRMELHAWYGSAAIMQLPSIHTSIARDSP